MKIRELLSKITAEDVEQNKDIIVTETQLMFINETKKLKLPDCKDGVCKIEHQ